MNTKRSVQMFVSSVLPAGVLCAHSTFGKCKKAGMLHALQIHPTNSTRQLTKMH